MKIYFLYILLIGSFLHAQIDYEMYFYDKQLRLDYFHSGNSNDDYYSFDELIEEPFWGGSKLNLIDTIGYGNFMFYVFDLQSNKMIYSRGYSTLFQEWQTTEEAKKINRTFTETLVFPFPRDSVRIEIHDRDSKNIFRKRHQFVIDPESYFIKKDRRKLFDTIKVHNSGVSSQKLDIVFIPDGYTEAEMAKFENDCRRFAGYLFKYEPFSEMKEKINIWGVKAISGDTGIDIPGDSVWKNTLLNTTFYTFDSERYLMTMDNKAVRDVASNVPYDQIYILANSDKYGGGAIYNYYSTTVVDNPFSEKIFIHELGHGLVGLADEYYTSDVAYQNYYPLDVEPWEPNITTLVDFQSKWKYLLENDAEIPSNPEIDDLLKIGVYEGGGYVEKGVYRSTPSSIMKGWDVNEFNEVSKNAIIKIINFYSE